MIKIQMQKWFGTNLHRTGANIRWKVERYPRMWPHRGLFLSCLFTMNIPEAIIAKMRRSRDEDTTTPAAKLE